MTAVENKVCIVTGSGRGLGKEFARILLDHGARVCISDLQEETTAETTKEFQQKYGDGHVCGIVCDVTKEDQFINLFDETENRFGVKCVDILVNNAGVNTNQGWRLCMAVNIIALMHGVEIAVQRMSSSANKGSIINIASAAGIIAGEGGLEAMGYAISKHGVVQCTRSVAETYYRHGVSIKSLCPSWADTQIVSSAKAILPDDVVEKIDASIKLSGGLMPPKFVAEGFYKLVTECENGTVLGCLPDTPLIEIQDTGKWRLHALVAQGKIFGRLAGKDIFTVAHQWLFLVMLSFLILFIVVWLC